MRYLFAVANNQSTNIRILDVIEIPGEYTVPMLGLQKESGQEPPEFLWGNRWVGLV